MVNISNPCCNYQSISVWMVYPPGVCLREVNVFKFSPRMLGWSFLSPMHMYLGRSFGFFCIAVMCAATFPSYIGPTDYGQHFTYLFWTSLTRLLFSICCLGLIHELFEVSYPHKPFNLIPESHIPFGIVSYIFMDGTNFLDVATYRPSWL